MFPERCSKISFHVRTLSCLCPSEGLRMHMGTGLSSCSWVCICMWPRVWAHIHGSEHMFMHLSICLYVWAQVYASEYRFMHLNTDLCVWAQVHVSEQRPGQARDSLADSASWCGPGRLAAEQQSSIYLQLRLWPSGPKCRFCGSANVCPSELFFQQNPEPPRALETRSKILSSSRTPQGWGTL